MAKAGGLSHTAISRIWHTFGLQPHRSEPFTLSIDPLLVEKVRDIVGLYLDPPAYAAVFCVDEKRRFKRSIARSRCCRCNLDKWNIERMTQTPRHDDTVRRAQCEDVPKWLDVHIIMGRSAAAPSAACRSSKRPFRNSSTRIRPIRNRSCGRRRR